jgi:hypothetical protein
VKYITNNFFFFVSSKIDVSNQVESLLGQLVEKDNVTFVYYHASNEKINLQHEKVKNETKKIERKKGEGRKRILNVRMYCCYYLN